MESTRLYVRNILLSFDNDEITNELKSMGVEMIGSLKHVRARTPQGKLTNFKTGDRFVEIVVPPEPLPKKKSVGIFTASLYHKEQKQTIEEIDCGNCREKGHTRKNCENDPVCYDCLKSGHKRGSMICPVLATASNSAMSGKTETKVKRNEEEDDLYETDHGDKPEKTENESSESGDSQGEKGNDVTQEKDQGTPNPAKDKLQEQEKSEIKTKTIPQNLWSAAAQKSPVGRAGSPARSRKVDDRSQEMESESKKQRKKKHKKVMH